MPPFHFFEVDGKPIDGVYGQLDFATYKKYTQFRGMPLTSCALCGQGSKYVKEDGVELKICRGVCYITLPDELTVPIPRIYSASVLRFVRKR